MDKSFFPQESEIPPEHRVKEIHQREYLINGEIRTWQGATEKVLSPICIRNGDEVKQKEIGSFPLLTAKESMESLEAAVKAYNDGDGYWPSLPARERIKYVSNFLDRMVKVREEVVNLLMWEIGKSRKDSEKEFDRTVEYGRATISAVEELTKSSSKFVTVEGIKGKIKRAPLGVVLCMGPFNYPLNETYTTLIPSLIMGNTIIFKPAKYGTLLHEPLLKAYQECFPEGVVNSIYGDGQTIISPIMSDGRIDALAFIGSSNIAHKIRDLHPNPHSLRCVLGLGAKNPAIILDDADLETAVNKCVQGSLSYNGQRCTALKAPSPQRGIADKFVQKFSEKVDNLVWGMPWTENVFSTPLPEANKTKYLSDLIEDAKTYGAKIVNKIGGQVNMTFLSPTVLYPVNNKMRIYHEEQFGPVVPIIPFDSIDEPLQYIRNSRYRQQVSLFGRDPEVLGNLIDRLSNKVCRINLNSQCQRGPDVWPFTGRLDSAERSLSVTGALYEFSIDSVFGAEDTEENNRIISEIIRRGASQFLSED